MKLAPDDAARAKQVLNKVLERAQAATQAGDLETAIACLMSVRDATVGAAVTLRDLADATRSRALKTLEREPA